VEVVGLTNRLVQWRALVLHGNESSVAIHYGESP